MLALLTLAWQFLPAAQIDGISRDWLAERLSPPLFDADPKAAREKVRYLVKLLDDALAIRTHEGERERGVYKLDFAGLTVDVLEIRHAAREGNHQKLVSRAVAPLLAGMNYLWLADPFFEHIGASLDIWCLTALLETANARLTESEAAGARGGSRAGISHEEACDLLDRAGLWLAGRRDLLRRREPRLLRKIAERLTECCVRARHPLGNISNESETLPDPQTSLVGREQEIEAIQGLVRAERLVTLTGPGGIGKTRLALAVAGKIKADFTSSIAFVDVSTVTETGTLAQTLALTLGLARGVKQDWQTLLIEFLGDKRLLLIWDNCEQSVAACRAQAETLLTTCPGLHLLVTSRERLNTQTFPEAVYAVPSLSLPTPFDAAVHPESLRGYDALKLFEVRAKLVQPRFTLTTETSPVVLQICQLLDGLPLALELAAALLPYCNVRQIACELQKQMPTLKDGHRVGTLRHDSLDAAFNLSYAGLIPSEQRAFRFLGVFVGGFTIAAAMSVLPKTGDAEAGLMLANLVRKSLVAEEEQHGERRYRLLETLRSYALDRLRETREWEAARHQHRQYYSELVEEAEVPLKGNTPKPWMDRLETEIANLRAALEWRLDETTVRLSCSLLRFWRVRGYLQEGRRWFEHSAGADAALELRSRAFNGAGFLAFTLGDFEDAKRLYGQSLTLAQQSGNETAIAQAVSYAGFVLAHLGDRDTAEAMIEQSLESSQRHGDREGIARGLNYAGMVATYRCNYGRARTMLEASLGITRELDDVYGIANCLHNLGIVSSFQLDYPASNRYFAASLAHWRSMDDKFSTANALNGLGEVALQSCDFEAAEAYYDESLSLRKQTGDKYGQANSLNGLGEALFYQGNSTGAQTLLEEALQLRRQIEDTQSIPHSLYNLGEVAFSQEDLPAARALYQESLRLMRENDDQYGGAYALESLAFTLLTYERAEAGARLLGAADALRTALSSPRSPYTEALYRSRAETLRILLGTAAFDAYRQDGTGMAWKEAVAVALDESVQMAADEKENVEQEQN